MSTDEPIEITVTAEYIRNAPDLQVRLFIRMLMANESYPLTLDEKIEILRNEADRLERQQSGNGGEGK